MNALHGNDMTTPAAYVLIVDDEPRLADNIVRYLIRHGYQARAVHSVHAALGAIAERAPDIALIDLNLPDGHGADLCRQIYRQHPAMPALIISASLDAPAITSLRHSGVCGFLAKPFSLAILRDLIVDILRGDSAVSLQLRPDQAAN